MKKQFRVQERCQASVRVRCPGARGLRPEGRRDHHPEVDVEDQEVPEPGRESFCSGREVGRVLIDRDQVEIRPCQPAPRETGKLNRQSFLVQQRGEQKCLLCGAKSS